MKKITFVVAMFFVAIFLGSSCSGPQLGQVASRESMDKINGRNSQIPAPFVGTRPTIEQSKPTRPTQVQVNKPKINNNTIVKEKENANKTVINNKRPSRKPDAVLTHLVIKGDTLSLISKKYGCTVSEIFNHNDALKQSSAIQQGMILKVPYFK